MATRTIVTSQPDVACDVCGRRLLRGEQPDAFVVAGARRLVCELCAPRAVHEGWQRESDGDAVTLPPPRSRRGRGLFERLSVSWRGTSKLPPGIAEREDSPAADPWVGQQLHGQHPFEQQPYDFLAPRSGEPAPAQAPELLPTLEGAEPHDPSNLARESVDPAQEFVDLEQALAIFNAGEFPRRVAGVARSLGAPEVTVHPAEHARSVIVIVVAWELCWYRYEVDLDELEPHARASAQGTELEQLAREDRIGNAHAADSGALALG